MDTARLLSSPRELPVLSVSILQGARVFVTLCASVHFARRNSNTLRSQVFLTSIPQTALIAIRALWDNLVSVLTHYTKKDFDEPFGGPTVRDLVLLKPEVVLLCDASGDFGNGQSITYRALFPKCPTQDR
jgi:hypothetical protein